MRYSLVEEAAFHSMRVISLASSRSAFGTASCRKCFQRVVDLASWRSTLCTASWWKVFYGLTWPRGGVHALYSLVGEGFPAVR